MLACPLDLCLRYFCWVGRLLEFLFPLADRCLTLDFFKVRRILVLAPDTVDTLHCQAVPMGSIPLSEEETVELIYSLMEAFWAEISRLKKTRRFIFLRWKSAESKKPAHHFGPVRKILSLILCFVS